MKHCPVGASQNWPAAQVAGRKPPQAAFWADAPLGASSSNASRTIGSRATRFIWCVVMVAPPREMMYATTG